MNKVRALYNYFFVPSAIELATTALRKATIGRIEAEQGRDWSLAMLEYQGKREAALSEFLATAKALIGETDPTPPAPAPSAPAAADHFAFEESQGPRLAKRSRGGLLKAVA